MVKNPRETPGPGAIRPLNLPEPVGVEEDESQRPVSVTLRGRRLKIAAVDDVWEIADEWWRPEPIGRRYYRVITEDGAGATIYRDLVNGGWYRQEG